VTCISDVHLEYLGSRENVARAKGELVAGLPDDGVAILNRDDELVGELARLCRGRVVTYGLAGPADVRADQIRFERAGMAFRVLAGPKRAEARLPAWGQHNVANALAAAAVGLELGMDLDASLAPDCIEHVPTVEEATTRLRTILRAGDVVLIKGSRILQMERIVTALAPTCSSESFSARFSPPSSRQRSAGGGFRCSRVPMLISGCGKTRPPSIAER